MVWRVVRHLPVQAHGLSQGKITDWEHIQSPERKHQQHLDGPGTDAGELHQHFGHLFVIKRVEKTKIEFSLSNATRDFPNVTNLRPTQSTASQGCFAHAMKVIGVKGRCTEMFEQAPFYTARRLDGELLIDDGPYQCMKARMRVTLQRAGAVLRNHAGQHGINAGQVAFGLAQLFVHVPPSPTERTP